MHNLESWGTKILGERYSVIRIDSTLLVLIVTTLELHDVIKECFKSIKLLGFAYLSGYVGDGKKCPKFFSTVWALSNF